MKLLAGISAIVLDLPAIIWFVWAARIAFSKALLELLHIPMTVAATTFLATTPVLNLLWEASMTERDVNLVGLIVGVEFFVLVMGFGYSDEFAPSKKKPRNELASSPQPSSSLPSPTIAVIPIALIAIILVGVLIMSLLPLGAAALEDPTIAYGAIVNDAPTPSGTYGMGSFLKMAGVILALLLYYYRRFSKVKTEADLNVFKKNTGLYGTLSNPLVCSGLLVATVLVSIATRISFSGVGWLVAGLLCVNNLVQTIRTDLFEELESQGQPTSS